MELARPRRVFQLSTFQAAVDHSRSTIHLPLSALPYLARPASEPMTISHTSSTTGAILIIEAHLSPYRGRRNSGGSVASPNSHRHSSLLLFCVSAFVIRSPYACTITNTFIKYFSFWPSTSPCRHLSPLKRYTAMGTLTGDVSRLPGFCDHKLPTSCRLTSIPLCCACADERAHAPSYSTYIDGIGFVSRGTRWQRYCWFCKGV